MVRVKAVGLIAVLGTLSLVAVTKVAVSGNDFQYWSYYLFKIYSTNQVSGELFTSAKAYENATEMGLYMISPRIKYNLCRNINLQLNYTYLKIRNDEGHFITHSRIEAEANPYFDLFGTCQVDIRNRFEVRHIEQKGWNNNRYRCRLQTKLPLTKCGMIRSVFASTEYFYDFALHKQTDLWTIPLGVNANINRFLDLQIFYMVQRKRELNGWVSNQIAGSKLTIHLWNGGQNKKNEQEKIK